MKSTGYRKTRAFKFVLLLVIVVGLGIVSAVFMGYRRILGDKAQSFSIALHDAGMSIDKFHQVSTRDGVAKWRLEAGSARYIDPSKQAVLEDIAITFFLKDNQTATLSAAKGVLKTETSDIDVAGNVVVQNQDVSLETEALSYFHEQSLVSARVPVRITGIEFQFTADSMSFDLESNRTTLVGNVEGTFDEGFKL